MAANETDHSRKKLESSVRHLQGLYVIVAGLALSDAIASLLGGNGVGWRGPVPLMLTTAFVVTLVPFFHGAMRHFDDTYLLPKGDLDIGQASLAVDFGFLFAESGILFALARQIRDPLDFTIDLCILLFADIAWVFAISGAARKGKPLHREIVAFMRSPLTNEVAQQHWARNNMRFLAVFSCIALGQTGPWSLDQRIWALIVLAGSIGRTVLDYRGSWGFYFPYSPSHLED